MMIATGTEFKFNLSVWIFAVVYSLYNVFSFTNRIDEFFSDHGDDFESGWSLFGRLKDVSDYEWKTWKKFSIFLFPWLCINTISVELIKTYDVLSISKCFTFVSFALILYKFGLVGLLVFIFQPLIYYSIILLGGKTKLIWITSCSLMFCINFVKKIYENSEKIYFPEIDGDDLYMLVITVSWINLRCISYSLECVKCGNDSKNLKTDLFEMFGYVFYAPLLFLGPIVLYNDFQTSLKTKSDIPFSGKAICFVYNFSRYLFWLLFVELCLHFIYFNAFAYHVEIIRLMPSWCLYGGGLWMGFYFYLKYLVVYGMAGSWAALDNVEPQTPPRCIARVHRYSQMWKYFDVGLYKFLLRYIYQPVVDGVNKDNILYLSVVRAFGSLLCFLFVYFWHGAHDFILIWTILNYFGIVIESVSKTIVRSKQYKQFQGSVLKTPEMNNRFEALLATPILIMSALSNFYFFAGYDVGNIYFDRLLNQSNLTTIVLFLILFCSCRAVQNFDKIDATKIKMHL